MTDNNIEELYKEHSHTVYRYLLSLCRSEQTAEELTQETFYRAILSVSRYDGTCKFSVWLCQIAKHLWYQHLRKEKKNHMTFSISDEPISAPLEEQLIIKEESRELYESIHSLSEPYREVVYLRMLGNLSFAQIGDIMSRSETWARVTFFRAKKQLSERRKSNED